MSMSPRRSAARSRISPSRAAIPSKRTIVVCAGARFRGCRRAQAEKNLTQARSQLDDLKKGLRPTEIAALEAQIERAKANLKLSGDQLARREQLGDTDVISKEELDQARAQRDADQAQVNQLAAELETAKLGGREDAIRAAQAAVASQTAALDKAKWSFDQKQQFAPAHAFVHDTLYRQGEWVAAGNPVVVLLPPENLKVRFFVPETALAQIKPGQAVQIFFDGAVKKYSATVNYISTQNEFTPPVIYNRENRAKLVYMIEAKFSPADAADLRPGQPVDVKLVAMKTIVKIIAYCIWFGVTLWLSFWFFG